MDATRGTPDPKPPNAIHGLRLFIAFWTTFTALYAAAIVQRTFVDGDMSGLAMVAGVGAVISVWLYLHDISQSTRDGALGVSPSRRGFANRQLAILVTIAVVLVINVTLVFKAVLDRGVVPLLRGVLTFTLTLVIRHILTQSLGNNSPPEI